MNRTAARAQLGSIAAKHEERAGRGDRSDERLLALLGLGRALAALGDPRAPDLLLAAIDLADDLGRLEQVRQASIELGACLVSGGDAALGRAHLERALDESRRAGALDQVDRAALELARAWVLSGDATRGRAALALVAAQGAPRAWLVRGQLARLAGAEDEALAALRRATEPARAGDALEQAIVALLAAEAQGGEPVRSLQDWLAALDERQLRRALEAALEIGAAPEPDAPRVAAEAIRRLIAATSVELQVPAGTVCSPANGPEEAELTLRAGRVELRVAGGGPEREALAHVALAACARLGQPLAEEASRVLRLLDRLLGSDLEGAQLLDLAAQLAVEATGAARGRLVLLPAERDLEARPEAEFVSSSLLRHVVLSGRPLLLEDAAGSPPGSAGESVGARGLRSVLAAPLLGRCGQVLGVLYLDDPGTIGRFGPTELAVATGFAARLGPQVESHLRARLRRDARRAELGKGAGLVAESPAMRAVLDGVERASRSDAALLLSGEPGVGKELVARAVHRGGARAAGPFLAVACGTLADELLESELFGHKAGAFTGALVEKQGLFHAARGGVLFLDGLDDASPRLQAELLRAVESREVRPLGGETESVDVRVIASWNGDPAAAVQAGALRQDLFYRLGVLRIAVPPLRERREDLPRIVDGMLRELGLAGRELGAGVLARLEAHAWPGNLRELQACLERAALEAGEGPIRVAHLRLDRRPARGGPPLQLNPRQLRLIDALRPGQVVRTGEYAETSSVSPATAWRDLTDLVAKGLLESQGKGRGAVYRLARLA